MNKTSKAAAAEFGDSRFRSNYSCESQRTEFDVSQTSRKLVSEFRARLTKKATTQQSHEIKGS